MTSDPLPAGSLSAWVDGLADALAGRADSDVACGSCTACCRASQFIHIGPTERDALAHIPAALRFPAPGLPKGHVLLGYDREGRCPMLVEGGCSVYEHRPRTCRTYDCRVFAATGIIADNSAIAAQAARWRFSINSARDEALQQAIAAAARWCSAHREELPAPARASDTQLAVLSVELHRCFIDHQDGQWLAATPTDDEVRRVLHTIAPPA